MPTPSPRFVLLFALVLAALLAAEAGYLLALRAPEGWGVLALAFALVVAAAIPAVEDKP